MSRNSVIHTSNRLLFRNHALSSTFSHHIANKLIMSDGIYTAKILFCSFLFTFFSPSPLCAPTSKITFTFHSPAEAQKIVSSMSHVLAAQTATNRKLIIRLCLSMLRKTKTSLIILLNSGDVMSLNYFIDELIIHSFICLAELIQCCEDCDIKGGSMFLRNCTLGKSTVSWLVSTDTIAQRIQESWFLGS